MRLHACRVDHDDLLLGSLGGQPLHHPGKDHNVAPLLTTVVEGLGRTVLTGRMSLYQPVAVDKDYAAQRSSVIEARLAL
jgi:hypothetical protein